LISSYPIFTFTKRLRFLCSLYIYLPLSAIVFHKQLKHPLHKRWYIVIGVCSDYQNHRNGEWSTSSPLRKSSIGWTKLWCDWQGA